MKSCNEGKGQGIKWHRDSSLEDLDFADDLALLSEGSQQMQSKTAEIAQASQSLGLKVHEGKTKLLKIGANDNSKISLNGKDVEEVDTFTYLGSVIDIKGVPDAAVSEHELAKQGQPSYN